MDMKRTVFFFTLSLAAMLAHAQLTLEECQRRAQDNYPLVRQYGLIEKARGYDLSNAGKGYLPQFSLSGKATYQSDITRLPVEIPNLDIKTASKDQYQVMLEVQQTLWGWWGYTFQKTIDACRLGSGTGKTACRHVCLD